MTQSDQFLVGQILARDAQAFGVLFGRYAEIIRAHLLRTVRDEAAAEDLVQEVFLRVWTRAGQWEGRGPFKAWLFRMATNLALNHLRSVERRREQLLETPPAVTNDEDESPVPGWMIDTSTVGADTALEQAEEHKLIRQLVDELPEEKRRVLRLVQDDEMDIHDVARALTIPEGTVRSRLHYAVKQLAQEWKEIAAEWEEL